MAFSVNKFNKQRLFNIDASKYLPEECPWECAANPETGELLPYAKLESLYDFALAMEGGAENYVFTIIGLYRGTKGNFGPSFNVATEYSYVNFPAHMNQQCEELLQDAAAVNAIKRGRIGFKVRQYTQARYGRTCYTPEFVDIDPIRAKSIIDGCVKRGVIPQ